MASYSSGASSKSPGRTPPFVLVALVLVVAVLGFNYWKLSSSNKTLRGENDRFIIAEKDSTEQKLNVEKNLNAAREELRVLQGNIDQVKKSLRDREAEFESLKAEQRKVDDERKQCKDSLAACDTDLKADKINLEKMTAEKAKLEEAAKNRVCSIAECLKPMKDVAGIATKLVGTDAITKALTEGKLDAAKLMEGLARIEAPAQPKPEPVVQAVQDVVQDNPNQVSSALLAASASNNASENLKFVRETNKPVHETNPNDQSKGQPQNSKGEDKLKTDENVEAEKKSNMTKDENERGADGVVISSPKPTIPNESEPQTTNEPVVTSDPAADEPVTVAPH